MHSASPRHFWSKYQEYPFFSLVFTSHWRSGQFSWITYLLNAPNVKQILLCLFYSLLNMPARRPMVSSQFVIQRVSQVGTNTYLRFQGYDGRRIPLWASDLKPDLDLGPHQISCQIVIPSVGGGPDGRWLDHKAVSHEWFRTILLVLVLW